MNFRNSDDYGRLTSQKNLDLNNGSLSYQPYDSECEDAVNIKLKTAC